MLNYCLFENMKFYIINLFYTISCIISEQSYYNEEHQRDWTRGNKKLKVDISLKEIEIQCVK